VPADGPPTVWYNSTFQRLWSDDVDNGNLSVDDFDDANVSSRAEFAHRLARSTDVPFARPPQATSNWNSGDFGDYSPGGRRESVHPTGASLEDGVYIKRCVRQHLRHTALDDTSPRERNDPVRCAGRSGSARSVITGLPFPRTIEMGRSVNAGQSTKHESSRSTFLQTADCSTAQAGIRPRPVHRSFGFAATDRRRHDHGDAASRHAGLPRLEFVDSRL